MKKMMVIMLCLLLFICTACEKLPPAERVTDAQTPVYKDSSWRAKTEPVTLTVASILQKSFPEEYPEWSDDPVSRMIINLTGVQLNVLIWEGNLYRGSIAETLFRQKLQTDLIVVDNEEDIAKLIASGEVWAIDELAKQYCPEFWDAFDALEIENNRAADGHIYALRTGYRDDAYYADDRFGIEPPRTMVLKTEVLEALGAEVPTSLEEFEKLLYTVKDNAVKLMISEPLRIAEPLDNPVSDWMGLTQSLTWDRKIQKIRTPYTNKDWLEYFQMMNRWYTDKVLGLPVIDPTDPMIQGRETEEEKMEFARRVYVSGSATTAFAKGYGQNSGGGVALRTGSAGHETPLPYHLIQEPLSYRGEIRYVAEDYEIGFTEPTAAAVLIGKANEPERALLYLQFLSGEEGTKLTKWGIEGTHYTLNEEKQPEIADKYRIDTNYLMMTEGVGYWSYLYDMNTNAVMTQTEDYFYSNSDRLALREMQLNAAKNYKKYAEKNRNPVMQSARLSKDHGFYDRYQAIDTLWRETALAMVTAEKAADVPILWDTMQTKIQQLGIAEIEAAMTAQYLEALERYQKAGFFTED